MRRLFLSLALPAALFSVLTGCYRMRPSNGGGETKSISQERRVNPADVLLPPGYTIEAVARDFTFPSAVVFDAQNRLHVLESGYSYGEVWTEPKLIRIDNNGTRTVVATGTRNGPWSGVTYHDGNFYVAEGGTLEGGKILRIAPNGTITPMVDKLPTMGDHHTNGPVVRDGYVYFGLGTATNSGVVGTDNYEYGWLKREPRFHDIPCQDVVLSGLNFDTPNVLQDSSTRASTGAFSPYNTTSYPGQIIKGSLPCSGAIMRIAVTGGKLELVAWGIRNPFGMAFSNDGRLYVTENNYDVRGSRPVWGSGDVLWEIKEGMWYGWPDFSAGRPIRDEEEFKPPGKDPLKPLLRQYPNEPPKPAAILGVHSSSNGFDFSRSAAFGFEGEAFVAQFGDMAPKVGKVMAPVGYKIVRVDVQNGIIKDFVVNKGKRNGPASWLNSGGLERPVAARFDASGNTLYVVDFGVMRMSEKGPEPKPNSGVIWKITRK
ncbi:sorbosone dehydrogenase family protein [Telluribacter sp. SYSU D00476]|uniref:PQQ-dependent sugar dehydrogenase n=1 Tax=Telluribacter sp. SYSU D00476 TaxID=2811430 RepID=UPI001FF2AA2A|nr:PQQ-dependent sugar dehydrogenase [Telluribacter sp. SYSU D00476]